MPIEYELKYVLSKNILNEVEPWHRPHRIITIEQGYLAVLNQMNARVRHELSETDKWFITLKQKVNGRTVEIHHEIDPVDGVMLLEVSDPKLIKTRHEFPVSQGEKWEVDVFYNKEDIYFVMAEIELPEGVKSPYIPPFLRKHLIFEVPLTDNRFSNTKLGDVEYATTLYRKLLLEHQHG